MLKQSLYSILTISILLSGCGDSTIPESDQESSTYKKPSQSQKTSPKIESPSNPKQQDKTTSPQTSTPAKPQQENKTTPPKTSTPSKPQQEDKTTPPKTSTPSNPKQDEETTPPQTSTPSNPKQDEETTPPQTSTPTQSSRVLYECPATLKSEEKFKDTFISQRKEDIDFSSSKATETMTVSDIEALFNKAHKEDPTISKNLVLPEQSVWDKMDASEKTLYLVNWERCARGLRLFEGIDHDLEQGVTRKYAEYVANHHTAFRESAHRADGRSPGERMEDVGIILGENSEMYSENVAYFRATFSSKYPVMYEVEALSVYAWMYKDKDDDYGHREFILRTGLHENSGLKNQEGLIAAYTEIKHEKDSRGYYTTRAYIIMDGFDPTSDWDNNLAHTKRVPLYKKAK